MSIRLFGRKKKAAEANLLELTPCKFYGQESDAEGNVIVLIPKFKKQVSCKISGS